MNDIEKIKQRLKNMGEFDDNGWVARDALSVIEELQKENKALRLLVDWATECDFGYDQFADEYWKYKDEIKGMGYIDGMIHVAKRTMEESENDG